MLFCVREGGIGSLIVPAPDEHEIRARRLHELDDLFSWISEAHV